MVLTPQDARQLVDAVSRIEKSIRNIQVDFSTIIRGASSDFDKLKQKVDDVGKSSTDAMKKLRDEGTETVKLMTDSWTDFATKAESAINSVKHKMDEIDHHPAMQALFGNPSGRGAISGKQGGFFNGIGSLVQGMQSEVMSVLPVGGFLGLLLAGGKLNIADNVVGQKMLSTFQASMRTTGTDIVSFGAHVQNLENEFGKSADMAGRLGATLKTLSAGGISEGEALSKVSGATTSLGSDIAGALTGLDVYFGMASGRSAQLAVDMTQNLGVSLADATSQLQKLGDTFRGNGSSVETFVGTLLQASSSVRLQVTDVNDLAKTYMGLHDAIGQLAPGLSPQAVTASSLKAFTGLTQSIAGFGDVQKSFLGRSMGMGGGDPFAAITKFELGASGEGAGGRKQFLTDLVTKMTELGKQQGGSDVGRLEHVFKNSPLFNLPPDTARALAMAAFGGGGGTKPGTPEFNDAMEKVESLMKASQDPMDKLIENLQRVIATLGSLLLSLLTGTINVLASVGAGIIATMRGQDFGGDIIQAGISQELSKIGSASERFRDSLKVSGETGLQAFGEAVGKAPIVSESQLRQFQKENPGAVEHKSIGDVATQRSTKRTLLDTALSATPLGAPVTAVEAVIDALGGMKVLVQLNPTLSILPSSGTVEPQAH